MIDYNHNYCYSGLEIKLKYYNSMYAIFQIINEELKIQIQA